MLRQLLEHQGLLGHHSNRVYHSNRGGQGHQELVDCEKRLQQVQELQIVHSNQGVQRVQLYQPIQRLLEFHQVLVLRAGH